MDYSCLLWPETIKKQNNNSNKQQDKKAWKNYVLYLCTHVPIIRQVFTVLHCDKLLKQFTGFTIDPLYLASSGSEKSFPDIFEVVNIAILCDGWKTPQIYIPTPTFKRASPQWGVKGNS